MKLQDIDKKLDTFFDGEPARNGNASSALLFHIFLPAIAGGALVYYSVKGIANIVKKHKEKKTESVSIREIVDPENTISSDSSVNTPVAKVPVVKRSSRLVLKRNPEDN